MRNVTNNISLFMSILLLSFRHFEKNATNTFSFAPDFGTRYRHLPIVTISQEQRSHAIGQPNYVATVYHGIPPDLHKFMDRHGGKPYLAFLGRIAPDKGPLKAIESDWKHRA
jgi:hypothetical protein